MVNATSSGLFVEIKEAPQSPGPGFDLWSYRLIKMAVDIAGKKKKKSNPLSDSFPLVVSYSYQGYTLCWYFSHCVHFS